MSTFTHRANDALDTTSHSPAWRRWAALATLMLPVLLVAIDNTVLNFALPFSTADSPTATFGRSAPVAMEVAMALPVS